MGRGVAGNAGDFAAAADDRGEDGDGRGGGQAVLRGDGGGEFGDRAEANPRFFRPGARPLQYTQTR